MRAAIGSAILAACFAFASSAAQEPAPNPVMEHYRAYRAAFDAGDRERAEQEAAQALAASEARDGDSGRTAVLALNLASIRLMLRRYNDALAPAQRAHALAQTRGATAGIDPIFAELVLGRVELPLFTDAGQARLLRVLAQAQPTPDLLPELYLAAVDLAASAQARERYDTALQAWTYASRFSAGSSLGQAYAEGHAQVGIGSAIFLEDISARNGRGRVSRDRGEQARAAFIAAQRALQPLVRTPIPDGQLSIAQRVLAEALAWDAALGAKMWSDRQPHLPYEDDRPGAEIGPVLADTRPRCHFIFWLPRDFRYPEEGVRGQSVGAAVALIRVSPEGEVLEARPISHVGSVDFTAALRDTRGSWSADRRHSSPDNCRSEMTVLAPVSFTWRTSGATD